MQIVRIRLFILGLTFAAIPAWAQTTFPILGYRVLGNTLLNKQQIDIVTNPFVGPASDFETIQRALEALEKRYVIAGYGSVRVELPEQELDAGLVVLRVVEGVLGDITVQSNEFFDDDNVRHTLPALRPGQPVNIFALNRNLVLANEGGSKVTNVTFKRSSNNQEVDASVKVQGEDPQRWLAVMDNTGSDLNGRYRAGLVYQNSNVLNRDHALLLQLMSSPGYWGQVRIIGVSYRIPLYGLGDTVEFNASDSNVNSRGTVSGTDIAAVGKGSIVGLRYTRNLDPSAAWQHKLNAGLESRRYGNSGNTGDSSLSTLPFTLGYSGSWRSQQSDWSWNATLLKNIPAGPFGRESDLSADGGRLGARAAFETLKFGAQWTERFANQWTLRAGLSGQFTRDVLIAAEQFGIGGADSVRGYSEREVASDQGVRAGLELGFAPWEADPLRLIPLLFVDVAAVRRNSPLPGEIASERLSSAGLGLRAAYGRHASGRVDWGFGSQGASRLHASLVWIF
jgi:hemolysin activation/secretion protein